MNQADREGGKDFEEPEGHFSCNSGLPPGIRRGSTIESSMVVSSRQLKAVRWRLQLKVPDNIRQRVEMEVMRKELEQLRKIAARVVQPAPPEPQRRFRSRPFRVVVVNLSVPL